MIETPMRLQFLSIPPSFHHPAKLPAKVPRTPRVGTNHHFRPKSSLQNPYKRRITPANNRELLYTGPAVGLFGRAQRRGGPAERVFDEPEAVFC